jgi:hypothetical protein
MKQRNFHKLAMIRKEARGYTTVVPSKKRYKRLRRDTRMFLVRESL